MERFLSYIWNGLGQYSLATYEVPEFLLTFQASCCHEPSHIIYGDVGKHKLVSDHHYF